MVGKPLKRCVSLQRVAELKGAKQAASGLAAGASPQPVKRKTADAESTQLKKIKGKEGKLALARILQFYLFGARFSFAILCEPMT